MTAALAGAQILPALEFVGQSWRAGDDGGEHLPVQRGSLPPGRARLAERLRDGWRQNRSWLNAVPPMGDHQLWVNSLYFGGLPLALCLLALGFRDEPGEPG